MKSFSELHEARGKKLDKMPSALRNKAKKAVQKVMNKSYFKTIPIGRLMDALKQVGVVVLQEDGMEWQGMLSGYDHQANFTLGRVDSQHLADFGGKSGSGRKFTRYEPVDNCSLAMSWYKSASRKDGKYDIVAYIT